MVSYFGWVDGDQELQRRMLEVIELGAETGMVDELGSGPIRDTFSNVLFPGTSVLHTRIRYALFIPWLMQRAAREAARADQMRKVFRASEITLIDSLCKGSGDNRKGIIGHTVRGRLKRVPSEVYMSALRTWGIVDSTIAYPANYFERAAAQGRYSREQPDRESQEALELQQAAGFPVSLPPPPEGLLESTTLDLREEDVEYLRNRIRAAVPSSMLAWLIDNPPIDLLRWDGPWSIDNRRSLPPHLEEALSMAEFFAAVHYSVSLAYSYAVAEHVRDEEAREDCRTKIVKWLPYATGLVRQSDMARFWAFVGQHNPNIRATTRSFVDACVELMARGGDLTGAEALRLVTNREHSLKGARARLVNPPDKLAGERPPTPWGLNYRWPVVVDHVRDLTPEGPNR